MMYTTTYSKTIIENNQTWSTDDSATDITTNGVVAILPDIKVTTTLSTETLIDQTTNNMWYAVNDGAVPVAYTYDIGYIRLYRIKPSNTLGQTFTPQQHGMQIIDSFKIRIGTVTTAGNVTCSVYTSVGGSLITSKVVNITNFGFWTFTFPTPIFVNQSAPLYFLFSTTAADVSVPSHGGYPYGAIYLNDYNPNPGWDSTFGANGRSLKSVQQTFKISENSTLTKVILNLSKYNYTGINDATVIIKQGVTTLGTGTARIATTGYADTPFWLTEETTDSLDLVTSTEYTLHFIPPIDSTNSTCIGLKYNTTNVYADGEVTCVDNASGTSTPDDDLYFILKYADVNKNISIYNNVDPSTKCDIVNIALSNAVYTIDFDNTGSILYSDDFSTDKYNIDVYAISNIVHLSSGLYIENSGYIAYMVDCKYPNTGIPTLTATIDITAGTPKIQISIDGSTWYDIDTAIVDNVSTTYELDNTISLQLNGESIFYYRIYCDASATCTFKIFTLNIDTNTTTAQKPYIFYDTINMFKCDQAVNSGINCTVELIAEESILQPITIF